MAVERRKLREHAAEAAAFARCAVMHAARLVDTMMLHRKAPLGSD
jgi:hypothetical protein